MTLVGTSAGEGRGGTARTEGALCVACHPAGRTSAPASGTEMACEREQSSCSVFGPSAAGRGSLTDEAAGPGQSLGNLCPQPSEGTEGLEEAV